MWGAIGGKTAVSGVCGAESAAYPSSSTLFFSARSGQPAEVEGAGLAMVPCSPETANSVSWGEGGVGDGLAEMCGGDGDEARNKPCPWRTESGLLSMGDRMHEH